MSKKADNLMEVEYYANFNLVGELLILLKRQNPEDTRYIKAVEAMTEIGFYVNRLIMNERYHNQAISEYRSDKLRAIERARRAEND